MNALNVIAGAVFGMLVARSILAAAEYLAHWKEHPHAR